MSLDSAIPARQAAPQWGLQVWVSNATGWCALLAGVLSVLLSLASPASAQKRAESSESTEYQALIRQALEEYAAHNYAEARAAFLRAHELYPNARALRGVGMAEFELRNYPDSIERLEQALASRVRPLSGELRAQTEAALARAMGYVGRYELVLRPQPADARIAVDGVPIELRAGHPLILAVGEHVLRVQAVGYADEARAISVKGGEAQRLTLELRAAAPAAALAASAPPDRASLWSSPWLWTGVGALIAGGVITAVVIGAGNDDAREPIRGDIGGVVQTLGSR
jgi:tetratricopeptide (TPR) repeat protein